MRMSRSAESARATLHLFDASIVSEQLTGAISMANGVQFFLLLHRLPHLWTRLLLSMCIKSHRRLSFRFGGVRDPCLQFLPPHAVGIREGGNAINDKCRLGNFISKAGVYLVCKKEDRVDRIR